MTNWCKIKPGVCIIPPGMCIIPSGMSMWRILKLRARGRVSGSRPTLGWGTISNFLYFFHFCICMGNHLYLYLHSVCLLNCNVKINHDTKRAQSKRVFSGGPDSGSLQRAETKRLTWSEVWSQGLVRLQDQVTPCHPFVDSY